MAVCLCLYTSNDLGKKLMFMRASLMATVGTAYSVCYSKNLQQLIGCFINTDDLPGNQYGTWNASVLEDKDQATKIKEHLMSKGGKATAKDIIAYLEIPEVKAQFKLDKPPSIQTVQHWMHKLGYQWSLDPKGQYIDGHKRADIVHYQMHCYIPTWSRLEKQMCTYDSKTMQESPPTLGPGKKPVMVWFHDKSTFYANDCCLTQWVNCAEGAKPYAKGDGPLVMVADFVGIDGWLTGIK
ncbi:hypothetical protein RSOLAG1IB_11012 [Rhizoctonia solani AG-1 IB]|uniref:Uncharacterized protein n=1 Tax=Thanatephorus cucumeris (strain AG1-IB / isolate 7/3/14) TaxID=1108050 RepID=A0A0B7G697_THACB|nr:hypothetical protein RSOLAG1IB_11012 [Rhizoctonia solani AG-1 IB]